MRLTRVDRGRGRRLLLAGAMVLLFAESIWAQAGTSTATLTWRDEAVRQLRSPWFWFGMGAQAVFFGRFVVQWIVSERRKRSTVPVVFWYLSLIGGLSLFVYATHERDLVIMAGQLLACVIYVRNLMLIHDWESRRRRAGLPTTSDEAADPG